MILWLRKNLLNTPLNTLVTLACLAVIVWFGYGFIHWLTYGAQWSVVLKNWRLFGVGRYPVRQLWRVWVVLGVVLLNPLMGLIQTRTRPPQLRRALQITRWVLLPITLVLTLWLLGGGWGLRPVRTSLWGGLTLTLLVALISVILSFPVAILLALGRQSTWPVLRWMCTAYIELIRGLPLIGILFMAQVMLPLVIPSQWNLDRLARGIAGLVLFNAAYLAENVRGGLQAIPKGQVEAAKALGLGTPLTLGLIVLPQALRMVTPAIVGQFISLFKDTSLLSLFALFELMGISRSILAQPEFLGRHAEVYLFIGLIYWIFCYTMSWVSRRLEKTSP
jgi:general L-amino acid transport system permease protein